MSRQTATQQRSEYEARQAKWLKRTGLRKSKARPNKVLPFLDKYCYPPGFDHSTVYYLPSKFLYVMLTEPYSDKLPEAVTSLVNWSKGSGFDTAKAPEGAGLWNPGRCIPLLIAEHGSEKILEQLAEQMAGL